MHCRRCQSLRLTPLDKKYLGDNDVFRCQECGYLFSPPNGLQFIIVYLLQAKRRSAAAASTDRDRQ